MRRILLAFIWLSLCFSLKGTALGQVSPLIFL